jgi:hypothetical protein
MSWLRLDDGFTKHPQFAGWTAAQRWAWLEVMEYCARYRTRGRIPNDLSIMPRTTTPTLLSKAEASEWVHVGDDGHLWITNWEAFNPERSGDPDALDQAVADAFARNPQATANEVAKHVGGSRKLVLASIRRFRGGTNGGSEEPGGWFGEPVTRARSRPVPSQTTQRKAAAAPDDDHDPEAAAAARDSLERLGVDPGLADHFGPDMVLAWVELAEREATSNPAGYVVAGLRTGQPPGERLEPGDTPQTKVAPDIRRRNWVENVGWRLDLDDVELHLTDMGADTTERVGLLDLAADLRRNHA